MSPAHDRKLPSLVWPLENLRREAACSFRMVTVHGHVIGIGRQGGDVSAHNYAIAVLEEGRGAFEGITRRQSTRNRSRFGDATVSSIRDIKPTLLLAFVAPYSKINLDLALRKPSRGPTLNLNGTCEIRRTRPGHFSREILSKTGPVRGTVPK